MNVAAATGPMTGKNTLTNSPSEPHLKAFRVDLRCSGKSMKSQLCSAERKHWLKPITVQRALRIRRQRHACNHRKVAPEIRVGVLNVQGVVDEALVQGHVVAHRDEKCESRTPM